MLPAAVSSAARSSRDEALQRGFHLAFRNPQRIAGA